MGSEMCIRDSRYTLRRRRPPSPRPGLERPSYGDPSIARRCRPPPPRFEPRRRRDSSTMERRSGRRHLFSALLLAASKWIQLERCSGKYRTFSRSLARFKTFFTTEPIEMLFGKWTHGDPRNHWTRARFPHGRGHIWRNIPAHARRLIYMYSKRFCRSSDAA